MKKIFIAILLALVSLTLSAKEISKNSKTGMKLTENLGVYSISGSGGVIILGDIKQTRNTLATMVSCFGKEYIKDYLDCGEQKYEVKSDDQGMYITKVGLGAVKIRKSDATLFLLKTESIIAKDKGSKIIDIIKE